MGHYRRYGSTQARRVVLYVCLTIGIAASTQAQPNSPPEGSGWWLDSDQEWQLLPCPTISVDSSKVQRLPQGCKAVRPSIAYSLEADTLVRQDLAEARTRIRGLTQELKLSRDNLLSLQDTTEKALASATKALEDSLRLNDLQLKTLDDAQSAVFWSKVYATTALVGSLLLVGATIVF